MTIDLFYGCGPGGAAGDTPYAMAGINLDNGWGLGVFLRRGRAVDPGPELGAVNLWLGRGDLQVFIDKGRLLPRVRFQWDWIGPLRPRPA